MSDENIRNNEESAEEEKLNDELENLRDTFQNVLDETAAAAEQEPVIQELDYTAELAAEQTEEKIEPVQEEKKSKKKKGDKNRHKKLAVILPVVLCVLIIVPLVAYFVITVKEPNFNNFVMAYSAAEKADTATEKVSNYEKALSFCGDTGILSHFKQDVLEKIALATCESSGYSAAKAYISSNMTEDMLASPSDKDFKDFLGIGKQLNDISGTIFTKVAELIGDKTDDSDVDYDAFATQLGVSDLVKQEFVSAITSLGSGLAAENAAKPDKDKNKLQTAIASYLNAYKALTDLEIDCTSMLEDIIVKLFNYGYAYEAKLLIEQNMEAPETSGNEVFKAVLADIEAIKNYDADVFSDVLAQVELGKFTEADFIALFKNTSLSETAAKAIAQIEVTAAEAIQAENEHNLTKAGNYYSGAIGALDAFGFSTAKIGAEYIDLLITLGDTQTAKSVADSLFPEGTEIAKEVKPVLDELNRLYTAQDTVYQVFVPYYQNASYGMEIDKKEVHAALDALVTADADAYVKAYVEYYKFFAEAITDSDKATMQKYLESFASAMSAYPLTYSNDLAMLYGMNGEYDKAAQTAEMTLALNIADDYAGSIKAFSQRIANDVDGALETAEKSMELSETVQYCAYEAAIDLFIKGDYAKSFDYAKQIYALQPTQSCCDLIIVLAALYDGSNTELQTELKALSEEINELYANYGMEVSSSAKGLMDGSLNAEDVFLAGEYDFA